MRKRGRRPPESRQDAPFTQSPSAASGVLVVPQSRYLDKPGLVLRQRKRWRTVQDVIHTSLAVRRPLNARRLILGLPTLSRPLS